MCMSESGELESGYRSLIQGTRVENGCVQNHSLTLYSLYSELNVAGYVIHSLSKITTTFQTLLAYSPASDSDAVTLAQLKHRSWTA